jgi:hypothetical protein
MREKKKITKTTKKRWACYALPAGFAERGYPKDSSCHMISKKYDGSQEPTLWLSDYLQAVKILGGT